MEAEKPYDLPSVSWRPRSAGGEVWVWRPENHGTNAPVQTKKTGFLAWAVRQRQQTFPLFFVLFRPSKDWMRPTHACVCAKFLQLCPTLCNPMNHSPPGSPVHGVSQARTLEWVAMLSSRGSSQPRDQKCISCIGRWILYHWATGEAQGPPVFGSFI